MYNCLCEQSSFFSEINTQEYNYWACGSPILWLCFHFLVSVLGSTKVFNMMNSSLSICYTFKGLPTWC